MLDSKQVNFVRPMSTVYYGFAIAGIVAGVGWLIGGIVYYNDMRNGVGYHPGSAYVVINLLLPALFTIFAGGLLVDYRESRKQFEFWLEFDFPERAWPKDGSDIPTVHKPVIKALRERATYIAALKIIQWAIEQQKDRESVKLKGLVDANDLGGGLEKLRASRKEVKIAIELLQNVHSQIGEDIERERIRLIAAKDLFLDEWGLSVYAEDFKSAGDEISRYVGYGFQTCRLALTDVRLSSRLGDIINQAGAAVILLVERYSGETLPSEPPEESTASALELEESQTT